MVARTREPNLRRRRGGAEVTSRLGRNVYQNSERRYRTATAVKIDEDAKSRLEELQAEIRLRTGEKVTQQDLLTWLIDDALESRDELVDSFRKSTVPLSEAEEEAMREGRTSTGVETDEEDIDESPY